MEAWQMAAEAAELYMDAHPALQAPIAVGADYAAGTVGRCARICGRYMNLRWREVRGEEEEVDYGEAVPEGGVFGRWNSAVFGSAEVAFDTIDRYEYKARGLAREKIESQKERLSEVGAELRERASANLREFQGVTLAGAQKLAREIRGGSRTKHQEANARYKALKEKRLEMLENGRRWTLDYASVAIRMSTYVSEPVLEHRARKEREANAEYIRERGRETAVEEQKQAGEEGPPRFGPEKAEEIVDEAISIAKAHARHSSEAHEKKGRLLERISDINEEIETRRSKARKLRERGRKLNRDGSYGELRVVNEEIKRANGGVRELRKEKREARRRARETRPEKHRYRLEWFRGEVRRENPGKKSGMDAFEHLIRGTRRLDEEMSDYIIEVSGGPTPEYEAQLRRAAGPEEETSPREGTEAAAAAGDPAEEGEASFPSGPPEEEKDPSKKETARKEASPKEKSPLRPPPGEREKEKAGKQSGPDRPMPPPPKEAPGKEAPGGEPREREAPSPGGRGLGL